MDEDRRLGPSVTLTTDIPLRARPGRGGSTGCADREAVLRSVPAAVVDVDHASDIAARRAVAVDSWDDDVSFADEVRAALVSGAIHVLYQPIGALSSGDLHKVEALARWDHPERGDLPPGVCIPIAERSGVIGELGERILFQACADAVLLRRAAIDVNVLGGVDLCVGTGEPVAVSGGPAGCGSVAAGSRHGRGLVPCRRSVGVRSFSVYVAVAARLVTGISAGPQFLVFLILFWTGSPAAGAQLRLDRITIGVGDDRRR